MRWWGKVVFPMRRIWNRLLIRLRIRNSGLLKLRHDVRSCEYQDIQVMWEMLHKKEELARSFGTEKKQCWNNFMEWAKRAPYFCRNF